MREVLGDRGSGARVARLVERAAGNAFYLEELIRAVAEGNGDALPETVLAMVQARLERLAPEARRVLRAASVFGQAFWRGGVAALLGGATRSGDSRVRSPSSSSASWSRRAASRRFPGEPEYAFRHALVREAAYAMLTDADRALGHRLAGEWLEAAGERDALVLAEHFERGGEPARAVALVPARGRKRRSRATTSSARSRAPRRASVRDSGVELGTLHVVEAEAHRWLGESAEAIERALVAMTLLQPRSDTYFRACAEAASAAMRARGVDTALRVGSMLRENMLATAPAAVAAARTSAALLLVGQVAEADALLSKLRADASTDPATRGEILRAQAMRALVAGDAERSRSHRGAGGRVVRRSRRPPLRVRRARERRLRLMELGAYADAEHELRASLSGAERMGLAYVVTGALHNLGLTLCRQRRFDEAVEMEQRAIEGAATQGDRRLEGAARVYLAMIHAEQGSFALAEREARVALGVLDDVPPVRVHAKAVLADALRNQGRASEAVSLANDAMTELERIGGIEEGDALVRIVWAECLRDAADARAGDAVRDAADRLMRRAKSIGDEAVRARFLDAIPENARTLAVGW